MSEALVREIAQIIVREQLLENWRFWTLLLAITVVAGSTSSFLASYFSRRAQTIADSADRATLIAHLKATTEAAENVRVEISHADWKSREWKTVRRQKLEQLYSLVYDLQAWLKRESDVRIFGNDKPELQNPCSHLEILARIYFPTLVSDVLALTIASSEIAAKTISIQSQLASAGSDGAKRKAAHDAFSALYAEAYPNFLSQIGNIEKKAPDLIAEVMGA